MTELYLKNLRTLKRFVEKNDLSDNHSNINFNCRVMIKVPHNRENLLCTAIITFETYNTGVVTIIDSDIDEYSFPTIFWAKNSKMTSVREKLNITGKHPKIGKYTAVITAISKVKEDVI